MGGAHEVLTSPLSACHAVAPRANPTSNRASFIFGLGEQGCSFDFCVGPPGM